MMGSPRQSAPDEEDEAVAHARLVALGVALSDASTVAKRRLPTTVCAGHPSQEAGANKIGPKWEQKEEHQGEQKGEQKAAAPDARCTVGACARAGQGQRPVLASANEP